MTQIKEKIRNSSLSMEASIHHTMCNKLQTNSKLMRTTKLKCICTICPKIDTIEQEITKENSPYTMIKIHKMQSY
jgi:hypothetical protein